LGLLAIAIARSASTVATYAVAQRRQIRLGWRSRRARKDLAVPQARPHRALGVGIVAAALAVTRLLAAFCRCTDGPWPSPVSSDSSSPSPWPRRTGRRGAPRVDPIDALRA
jgi:hypothetical protein